MVTRDAVKRNPGKRIKNGTPTRGIIIIKLKTIPGRNSNNVD
jgi:hypothetical protein